VQVPGSHKTIGVVLFSPFSNRPWTKADQDYLSLLCRFFVSAFNFRLASQKSEPEQVKNTIRELSSKLTRLTQDKQRLRDEMVLLSREHQNLLLDQDILNTKYDALKVRSNSLQRHLEMLVDLSKKESNEALRKYITVIENELETVEETVESAIEKQPAPSKDSDLQPEEVDPASIRGANLHEAIQSCLERTEQEIHEKEIKTVMDLPEDPPLLQMNHALFQEIFSFLVANAVEETKPGGEIHIRTQIYEEDKTQHFAHIKISDQGEGYFPVEITAVLHNQLTAEEQEKLSQVMTNLYVTKNLVENEGGRMWVDSKPGEGTTVSLLLAFQ
jgi:signal transduction histidine kinase